ncbi:MAG TPA: glycosyltransferase family 39 protein [Nitrososphaeraceae archaeon]|nr:glycosyltransferase family 39 protein [Nitrososphaeraceae archaeon]
MPILLSAFIHLWNPTGFPTFEQDEGIYLLRSLYVLNGLGPQLPPELYFYNYDHPYFGQFFLAGALSLINYPGSLDPSATIHSIELLHLVPRVLMGVLSIFDTFLVYKIGTMRYNRKVGFISSTLFAVMPATWFLRRIYLDSILLPFLLLSILFAVYYAKRTADENTNHSNKNKNYFDKNTILILLSGIFMGIAIFTKVPVFTMIPLIIFIILKSRKTGSRTKDRLKSTGIWLIPVILIPMIWPAYALSAGQLNEWLDGVLWQATRSDRPFPDEIKNVFFRMDPILLGLAAVGLAYSIVKKDYFILLWAFPYLIFLYLLNWVYFFHLIMILPAFSIVATKVLVDLFGAMKNKKLIGPIEITVFASIIFFGFIFSTMLITQNVNAPYFKLVSKITQMASTNDTGTNNVTQRTTLVGPGGIYSFYWVSSLVFGNDLDIKWFEENRDYIGGPFKTQKFILVTDDEMRSLFLGNSKKEHVQYATQLYNNSTLHETFKLDRTFSDFKSYPYTSILDDVYKEIAKMRGLDWRSYIEVKANY